MVPGIVCASFASRLPGISGMPMHVELSRLPNSSKEIRSPNVFRNVVLMPPSYNAKMGSRWSSSRRQDKERTSSEVEIGLSI